MRTKRTDPNYLTETFHPLPQLLVLGYGGHGKDTFAEMLAEKLELRSISSSKFACEKIVYPWFNNNVHERMYSSSEECFKDRREWRSLWYDLIQKYNGGDSARLAKEILKEYDIYVGMRSSREYVACKYIKLFTHIVWVDARDREPIENSLSCSIHFDSETMIYVDNNGNLENLEKEVLRCSELFRA